MSERAFTRSGLIMHHSLADGVSRNGLHTAASSGTMLKTAQARVSDSHNATATGSIDRVIRISTVLAVLAVAAVAAYVSYWHAYAVVRAHGETGITARLEPATIDGLVYASSMLILYAARHGIAVPSLARWLLGLGIAANLMANMAQGWSHGPVGTVVAAWPAVSLVGAYELLVWLIRTAGALEAGPAVGPMGSGTVLCTLAAPPPATPTGGRLRCRHEPQAANQREQPATEPTGLGTAQRDDDVPAADAINTEAVAAYRLSLQAGSPLSERRLAQMFGLTSRRWARARIAEARQ